MMYVSCQHHPHYTHPSIHTPHIHPPHIQPLPIHRPPIHPPHIHTPHTACYSVHDHLLTTYEASIKSVIYAQLGPSGLPGATQALMDLINTSSAVRDLMVNIYGLYVDDEVRGEVLGMMGWVWIYDEQRENPPRPITLSIHHTQGILFTLIHCTPPKHTNANTNTNQSNNQHQYHPKTPTTNTTQKHREPCTCQCKGKQQAIPHLRTHPQTITSHQKHSTHPFNSCGNRCAWLHGGGVPGGAT